MRMSSHWCATTISGRRLCGVDAQDENLMSRVVDAVEDAVGASPCGSHTVQCRSKLLAHAMRVLAQRTEDELGDGRRDSFGQGFAEGPSRRRG